MRLALFSLINVSVALLFGLSAYLQGFGWGVAALRVIIVLIVLQLAYVVWLVAVSMLSNKRADTAADPRNQDAAKKAGRDVVGGAADQTDHPVS